MKTKGVTFVLFGGTGDLTKKKLAPAFCSLMHEHKLAKGSNLIGIARKDFSDEGYKKFLINSVGEGKWKSSIRDFNVRYLKGDFSDDELYAKLSKMIKGDRVFYMATSFKFFPKIVKKLKKHKLNSSKKNFTRIVFEKPFGENLRSAKKLDRKIHRAFPEDNVYRIDHYLAKDTVQNINVLKFVNPMFYGSFSNKFIDSIEIIVDENVGVGNRINYYDEAGAIKDMMQNHMMQMLGRILMTKPEKLDYKSRHKEKLRVLENLELVLGEGNLLGQYKSYRAELKKAGLKNRNTETFARIILNCKTKQWDGVRIVLRTGKKVGKKCGQIRINYKLDSEAKELWKCFDRDKVLLDIYPKQDVTIIMNSLDPTCEGCVKPVKFKFNYEKEFGPNTTDAYSALLAEVIEGDNEMFAKDDTVIESWKVTEKILKGLGKMKFVRYADGSDPEKR